MQVSSCSNDTIRNRGDLAIWKKQQLKPEVMEIQNDLKSLNQILAIQEKQLRILLNDTTGLVLSRILR